MRVEWKKMLLGFAVFAGMTMMLSCSNEENYDPGGEPGVTEEPTETAFLSFYVGAGSLAGTRMIAVDPTDPGREEEQVVERVRMVLYENKAATVRYSWDLDARRGNGGSFEGSHVVPNSGSPDRFITIGQEVVRQDYKLLILVNAPPQLLDVTEKGRRLEELYREANVMKADLTTPNGIAADNNFYMTNDQGLIDVPKDELKPTKNDAEVSPFMVHVERAVAKVVVKEPESGIVVTPDGDAISDLSWGLDITNRYMYWMRQMTYTASGMMEGPGVSRRERYAMDPNFEGLHHYDEVTLGNYFEYLDVSDPLMDLPKQFGEYDYVAENTMAADEQYKNVTTRVILRGIYRPSGINLPANTRSGATGISFFTFEGLVFSVQQMANLVNNLPGDPGELSEPVLQRLHAVIIGFPDPSRLTNPQASFSENGIRYYHNGVSYYTIQIRHFDDGQVSEPMGFGRYGVVRNNVYNITVRSILGPGEPVIEKPVEPNDDPAYISADVNVLPWSVRTQDVEELYN